MNRTAWLIILSGCAATLAVFWFLGATDHPSYAYAAGRYTVFSLLIAVVVYHLSLKKYGKIAFLSLWAAMFLTYIGAYAVKHEYKRQAAIGMLDDIGALQDEILANAVDEEGMPVINETQIDPDANAIGEIGDIEALARRILQTEVNIGNAYIRDLMEGGLQQLMSPNALAEEGGIDRSFEALGGLKDKVKTHEEKYFKFFDGIPNMASNSGLPDSLRDSFIKGYRGAYKEKHALLREQWRYEMAIMDHYGDMLTSLRATEDIWYVEDDQILFETDEALADYQVLEQGLAQLIADQEQVSQRLIDLNKRYLEDGKQELQ